MRSSTIVLIIVAALLVFSPPYSVYAVFIVAGAIANEIFRRRYPD